ncbi:flavin-containing monooxygenase [Streptomyces tendae]
MISEQRANDPGYLDAGRREPRIAIVGAGFGGIAAAVKLKRAGLTDFVVYEKSQGPGGVWWDSRYPGAEVDTPTHIYSYSFKRFDWTRSHAQQAELQRYLEETIDEFGIRRHFHFGTEVEKVVWQDRTRTWHLHRAGAVETFDYVVLAVGILNVPAIPDWPGLKDFAGPAFHTSRWESEHDLTGKRVAVVGTGSTAAQVVPNLARDAKHVYVFQREPGWVNPKPITLYSAAERRALRSPLRYRLQRLRAYRASASSRHGGDIHRPGTPANQAAMNACKAFIDRVFKDRPDLAKAVTPAYPYFGKRPIKDSNFYEALKRDNVELVPVPVERITEDGVVDAEGTHRPVDVLVLSTGFKPSRYLSQIGVHGRRGVDIQDEWAGTPAAYLGIMVPEFPNLFMMYGPNTNSPVIVFMHELQADFITGAIRAARRLRAPVVEVRSGVHRRYNAWLQSKMRGSVWTTANNYFKSATGHVVTQWPVSPTVYWALAKLTRPLALTLRKR